MGDMSTRLMVRRPIRAIQRIRRLEVSYRGNLVKCTANQDERAMEELLRKIQRCNVHIVMWLREVNALNRKLSAERRTR